MDPLGTSSQNQVPTLESLDRDLRSLRLAIQVALVSLVILSGSLGVYLFRQVSLLRRQTEASLRTARQMVDHYNLNMATQALNFERQLIEYARTNPAFHERISRFYGPGMPRPDAGGE
jgi:hypothetical protein